MGDESRQRVKPLPAGLVLALVGVGLGPISGGTYPQTFDFRSWQGMIMAGVAAAGVVLLVAALVCFVASMWRRSQQLLTIGYGTAAGVFAWRAMLSLLEVGPLHPATWISTGLGVAAALAFIVESGDPERPER